MSERKEYLGDSVYVAIENGMFKLTTENGYPDDPRNVIYLEPEVYMALKRYATRALSGDDEPAPTAAPSTSYEEKP